MQRRLDAKDQVRMLRSFMKVVAIATIADAVPLTGENRVFAKLGLEELRRAVNPGLKALLEVAQISQKRAPNSAEVAFRIAPRINAAGRMDIARDVIELFSVKDMERARLLAGKLDRLNAERQEEERRIVKAVEEQIAGDSALSAAHCIVVDGEGWHRGVIGIAATRVVERYHRPAIVIARDGDEAFGSGRSIRAFHLLEAIEASHGLFTRYGGHSHACGFSMPAANVARLRTELDAFARARLSTEDLDPAVDIEAELRLDEVTPALYEALRLLEPYGTGNHEPTFAARNVRLIAPPKVLKEKHIKLKLKADYKTNNHPFSPVVEGEIRDEELSLATVSAMPLHTGELAGQRGEKSAIGQTQSGGETLTANRKLNPVFDALGWHMGERLQQSPLLAGDAIDIAFTIGVNDHPEFGGLELTLRDFKHVDSGNLRR
jgi:single-stranded-DNA-specific exonuclease